jgi:hypothetical protein
MATPDRPAPPIATDLRAENAELRRRVELAETELGELRREALDRRAEVRQLAEAFPAAMSRRAVTFAMLRDVANHPDKSGAIRRALAKLQRAPRKVLRMLQDR